MKNSVRVGWYFILAIFLLGWAAWAVPFWYDDVCHSLVLFSLVQQKQWAYPTLFPLSAEHLAPHSTMITIGPVPHYLFSLIFNFFPLSFENIRIVAVLLNAFTTLLLYKFHRSFFKPYAWQFAVLIILSNLQFIVYGSQYVGEIFLMQLTFWGIYHFLLALQKMNTNHLLFAQLFFYAAIFTKEYIFMPMALFLAIICLLLFIQNNHFYQKIIFQLLTLPLPLAIWYFFRFQSINEFLQYAQLKSDYQKEFLSFSWLPLKFILSKPIITLGTLLLIIKALLKKQKIDCFLLIFQTLLFMQFILSQGFDRLGTILIFIPAFYLAEWLAFVWHFVCKNDYAKALFILIFLVVFGQNTFNPYFWINKIKQDAVLTQLNHRLQEHNVSEIYTFEVGVIPYLKNIKVHTTDITPCSAYRINQPIDAEYLVAGEYAYTEYPNAWLPQNYEPIFTLEGYTLLKRKD